MSAYRFLCPQCGRAFEEGTSLTACPDCGVLLRFTVGAAGGPPSAGPAHLPPQLDIAALMQQVLAEEPPEEAIDEALRRLLQEQHPQADEALFRLLCGILSAQQRMWGIGRLEAATRVAQGRSEMHLSPQGQPEVTSFHFQAAGLEQLPEEQRKQVLQQLEEAARTGRPMPQRIVLTPPKGARGCAGTLAVVVALGLAASYWLCHMMAAR